MVECSLYFIKFITTHLPSIIVLETFAHRKKQTLFTKSFVRKSLRKEQKKTSFGKRNGHTRDMPWFVETKASYDSGRRILSRMIVAQFELSLLASSDIKWAITGHHWWFYANLL